ncbi:MAG: hypothetical protein Q7S77_01950 [Candidatus Staskawiczbacteria bacterium]|nr:hypothetical protein [Candidatus Staskawiczbacteria bacterium]
MNEAQRVQNSQRSDGNRHRSPEKQREQKIKDAFSDAKDRRRANKEIAWLLKRHPSKRIIDLLPAMKQRCYPLYVIRVALERAERKQYELGSEDAIFLAKFKASLEKSE